MRRLLATALGLTLAVTASAQTNFTANLTGAQENPSNGSTATGTALLTLNAAQDRLTISISISGLDLDGLQTPGNSQDNVSAAHIHRAPAGTNGSVVWGFFGSPNNDANGDTIVNPVAGTITTAWDLTEGNGGTNLGLELANLFAAGLYINFHTPAFPGGEIRGQIVPEPSSMMLALLGLPLLRRRR